MGIKAEVLKHLAGGHDQTTHGRARGGTSGVSRRSGVSKPAPARPIPSGKVKVGWSSIGGKMSRRVVNVGGIKIHAQVRHDVGAEQGYHVSFGPKDTHYSWMPHVPVSATFTRSEEAFGYGDRELDAWGKRIERARPEGGV